MLAFNSDESGAIRSWVTEMRHGDESHRPMRVKTSGSEWHAGAADGKALFVQDANGRLIKVAVSLEPQLAVSEPVEVANFEQLRIGFWAVLPDERFLVGVKDEGEGEIRRYDLVLDWTEHLTKRLSTPR